MKCPKCHYLSFDPEPRCRNCGFTLALDESEASDAATAGDVEARNITLEPLPKTATPATPATASADDVVRAADKTLDTPETSRPEPELTRAARELLRAEPTRRVVGTRGVAGQVPADSSRPVTTELPLFVKEAPAPVPDVEIAPPPPVVPVKPMPIARPAPPAARDRRTEGGKLGPLDDDLLDVLNRLDRREKNKPAVVRDLTDRPGTAARLAAAFIDASLVGALATVVVAMTLRWCALGWTDWSALPRLPLGAFLLMITLGYLLLFTSFGGQTPGKMVCRLRVVDAGETGVEATELGAGQALYREVIVLPSVLVFGLGFLPALVGEGRAVHDRLAATRVIRA